MKVTREHVVVAVLAAVAGGGGAFLSHAFDEAPLVGQQVAADGTPQSPAPGEAYEVSALPKGLGTASRARVTINVVSRSRSPAAEVELLRHDALDGLLHLGHFRLDATGAVAFTLPSGQYTALAHDEGARGEVRFEAPGDRALELFLELEPTRRTWLRVTEKGSKRPLPQATARQALGGEEGGPARVAAREWHSDGLGRIEITELGPEVVWVNVSAPDHLAKDARLDPDTDVEPSVELVVASWVSGMVRDENGTALPGISVSSEAATATVSAADGSYRLMVKAGHQSLVAVDPAGRSVTRVVDVAEAAALPGVDFVLGAPLRVTGTVVDAQSGAPVADVVVRAWAATTVVAEGHTDLLGRFELEGLPDTLVKVEASQGRGARVEQFGVDPHQAEPLTLRLEAAAALWGTATDQAGNAVAGARVTAEWTKGDELGAVTDETGTWRLDDVRPGVAELSAKVGIAAASGQVTVYLTPGLALRADLKVDLLGTVEGRVINGNGPPPWRVLAMPVDKGRGGQVTSSRADGTFRVQLTPGRWSFGVMGTGSFMVRGQDDATLVEAGRTVQVEVRAPDAQAADEEGIPEDYAISPGTLGAAFDGTDGHVRFGFLSSRGPAAKAGIVQGDELLAIGGTPVTDTLDAYARAQGLPGGVLDLSIRSAGGDRSVKVTLSGRPAAPEKK